MPFFSRSKQDAARSRQDDDGVGLDRDGGRDPDGGRDRAGVRDRDEATGSQPAGDRARFDPDDPRKPGSPTQVHRRTWLAVAKRALTEFKDDNCTDWAAALTYYAVLSIFPALIVFVSLLGLLGQGPDTVSKLLDIVGELGPKSAVDTLRGPITQVVDQRASTAGTTLVLGLLGALWSASGYVGAFIRASNAIWEVEEGRKFYILRPLQILVTIVGTLLLTLITLSLVASGNVARAIGDAIGLGDTAVTVWNIVKWPVIVLIVSIVISALYYIAPNVKPPRFRWFTVGGFLALLVWALASALFGLYVANFGSYNKTYGSLGAVITFLVWLWISNNAVLLGEEVNAELERGRELQAGQPAEEDILLPQRRAKKR